MFNNELKLKNIKILKYEKMNNKNTNDITHNNKSKATKRIKERLALYITNKFKKKIKIIRK